jgi:hypothetical protein
MPPTTIHELAAILIQAADLYRDNTGDPITVPALTTVVVPGVTAVIVVTPAPFIYTRRVVPVGKL